MIDQSKNPWFEEHAKLKWKYMKFPQDFDLRLKINLEEILHPTIDLSIEYIL